MTDAITAVTTFAALRARHDDALERRETEPQMLADIEEQAHDLYVAYLRSPESPADAVTVLRKAEGIGHVRLSAITDDGLVFHNDHTHAYGGTVPCEWVDARHAAKHATNGA